MTAKTLIASDALEVRLISKEVLLDLYRCATTKTQRNHVARAPKTRYLHQKLWGAQVIFHATRDAKGTIELIDGYTRCECLLRGLASVGEGDCLILHVHEVKSLGEKKSIYDQFDNPVASKKAPDRLDEGLRLTDSMGRFTSPLMSKGPRASSVKLGSGGRPVRDSVELLIDGMAYVDQLGLTRVTESTALLALYIVIGQYGSRFEQSEKFIRIMNRAVYDPRNPSRYTVPVKSFHDYYMEKRAQRSLSGTSNLSDVFQRGLGAFLKYLSRDYLIKPEALTTLVPLGTFIEVMATIK